MRFADRVSLALPPIFLRLALGVVFLWAGLVKVFDTESFRVSAPDAALLANLGVALPTVGASPAADAPASAAPAVRPVDPAAASPAEPAPSAPAAAPGGPGAAPAPGEAGLPFGLPLDLTDMALVHAGFAPGAASSAPTSAPAGRLLLPALATVAPIAPTAAPAADAVVPTVTQAPVAGRVYTAADFADATPVRAMHGVTLGVAKAASPPPLPSGEPGKALLPPTLGQGAWPVRLAWAATLAELLGGFFCLIGLLTRLSALFLAGVMATAMWLTQIGPAVVAGGATFGFLPNHPLTDTASWAFLQFQFVLFCAAVALLFAGAGALSIDGLIGGGRGHHDHDHDDAGDDDDGDDE